MSRQRVLFNVTKSQSPEGAVRAVWAAASRFSKACGGAPVTAHLRRQPDKFAHPVLLLTEVSR